MSTKDEYPWVDALVGAMIVVTILAFLAIVVLLLSHLFGAVISDSPPVVTPQPA
jgi:hypothetical protein